MNSEYFSSAKLAAYIALLLKIITINITATITIFRILPPDHFKYNEPVNVCAL